MPDLTSLLVRSSLGALRPSNGSRCGSCQRTPLAGERVHQMDKGPLLCELCFGQLPEERRQAVGSERIGVSERRLSVVARAA